MNNNKQQKQQKQRNNKRWLICCVIIFLFLLSTQNIVSQKLIIKTTTPVRSIEECRKLVLEKGDIEAYNDLLFALGRKNCENDYIFYSLIMAQRYNYPDAYYYVYNCITVFYYYSKIPIDEMALNFALECLKKGAELGAHNAQAELGRLYLKGEYVEQDTIKGKELYSKGWDIPIENLKPFWRK